MSRDFSCFSAVLCRAVVLMFVVELGMHNCNIISLWLLWTCAAEITFSLWWRNECMLTGSFLMVSTSLFCSLHRCPSRVFSINLQLSLSHQHEIFEKKGLFCLYWTSRHLHWCGASRVPAVGSSRFQSGCAAPSEPQGLPSLGQLVRTPAAAQWMVQKQSLTPPNIFQSVTGAKAGKAHHFFFLWSSPLSYVLWDIASHKSYSQHFEVSPYDCCIYPYQRAVNSRCCLMSWLNI